MSLRVQHFGDLFYEGHCFDFFSCEFTFVNVSVTVEEKDIDGENQDICVLSKLLNRDSVMAPTRLWCRRSVRKSSQVLSHSIAPDTVIA